MEQEPNVLVVGTEVSARYKGAFCEAKIKSVERRLKFKIQLTEDNTQHTFEEEDILGVTSINTITVGSKVTCRNPNSSSSESTVRGTIVKVFDQSKYLVAFDDGDQALLKRSLMYNKSGKHFASSETLDGLPLTNPESFSKSVMDSVQTGRRSSSRRSRLANQSLPTTPSTSTRRTTQASTLASKTRSQADDMKSEDSDNDSNSASNLIQKKRLRTPTKYIDADAGKVVCVDYADKRGKNKDVWFPALVLSRRFCDVSTSHKAELDEYRVRSFRDDRYYTVSKKEARKFDKATIRAQMKDAPKEDFSPELRAAIDKAISFIDNNRLPSHWDVDEYLGDSQDSQDDSSNSTVRSSSRRGVATTLPASSSKAEEANDSDSDNSFCTDSELEEQLQQETDKQKRDEAKKQAYLVKNDELLAQIYSNTIVDHDPNVKINGHQVNLYRLHRLVEKYGTWKVIKNNDKTWRKLFVRMGLGDPSALLPGSEEPDANQDGSAGGVASYLDGCKTALDQLKMLYEKVLFPFDDVQRKLGTNMNYNTSGSTSRRQRVERRRGEPRSRVNSISSTSSLANKRKPGTDTPKGGKKTEADADAEEQVAESSKSTTAAADKEKTSTTAKGKKKKSDTAPPQIEIKKEVEDDESQLVTSTSSPPPVSNKYTSLQFCDDPLSMEDLPAIDIKAGMIVSVFYVPDGIPYDAKVVSVKIDPDLREWIFYVHYCGWSNRYDEWISRKRIIKITDKTTAKRSKAKPPTKETEKDVSTSVSTSSSNNNSSSTSTSSRRSSFRGAESSASSTTTKPATSTKESSKDASKVDSGKPKRTRHESSTSLRSETKSSAKASEGDKRVSQRGRQANESVRERASSVSAGSTNRLKVDEPVVTSKRVRTISSSKSEATTAAIPPPSPSPSVTTRREKEKRQQNNNKSDEPAAATTVGAGLKTRNKDKEASVQKEKTSEKASTSKASKGQATEDTNDNNEKVAVAGSSKTTKAAPVVTAPTEGNKKESKRAPSAESKESETPTKKKRSAEEPSSAMMKRAEGMTANNESKQQVTVSATSSSAETIKTTTASSGGDTFDFVDEEEEMKSSNTGQSIPIILAHTPTTTLSAQNVNLSNPPSNLNETTTTTSKGDSSPTTTSSLRSFKKASKGSKLDSKEGNEEKLSINVDDQMNEPDTDTPGKKGDESKEKTNSIITPATSCVTSTSITPTEATTTPTTSTDPTSTIGDITGLASSKITLDALISENSTISMQSAGGEDLEVQHILASGAPSADDNTAIPTTSVSSNNRAESIVSAASSSTATVTTNTTEAAQPKSFSIDLYDDFNDDLYNEDLDRSPVNLVVAQDDDEEVEDEAAEPNQIEASQKKESEVTIKTKTESETAPSKAKEEKTTITPIDEVKSPKEVESTKPTESSKPSVESPAPCSPPHISAERSQHDKSLPHPLPSQIESVECRPNLEADAEPIRLGDTGGHSPVVADLSLPRPAQPEPVSSKFGIIPTTVPSSAMYYDPVSKQLLYKGLTPTTSLSATTPSIAAADNNHPRPISDPYHLAQQQQKPQTSKAGGFFPGPLHSLSTLAAANTTRNSKLPNIIVPPNIASNIMNMSTKIDQQSSPASATQPVATDKEDNADEADDDDDDEDDDCRVIDDGEEDNDADDEDNNGNIGSGQRMVLLKSKNALDRKRRLIGRPIGSNSPSNVDGVFSSQESSQDGEVDEDEEMIQTPSLSGSASKRGREKDIQAGGDGADKNNEDSSSGGGDGKEDEETQKKANEKEFASPIHSPSKKRRRVRGRTPSESMGGQTTASKEKDKAVGCSTRGRTYVRSSLFGGQSDLYGTSSVTSAVLAHHNNQHRNSPTNDYQRHYPSSNVDYSAPANPAPASSNLANFKPRVPERPDYSSWKDYKMSIPEEEVLVPKKKKATADDGDDDEESDEPTQVLNYIANFKPSDDPEKNIAAFEEIQAVLRESYSIYKEAIAQYERRRKKILYKTARAEKKAKRDAAKAAALTAAAASKSESSTITTTAAAAKAKSGSGSDSGSGSSNNYRKAERVTRFKRGNSNMNNSDEEKITAAASATLGGQ